MHFDSRFNGILRNIVVLNGSVQMENAIEL